MKFRLCTGCGHFILTASNLKEDKEDIPFLCASCRITQGLEFLSLSQRKLSKKELRKAYAEHGIEMVDKKDYKEGAKDLDKKMEEKAAYCMKSIEEGNFTLHSSMVYIQNLGTSNCYYICKACFKVWYKSLTKEEQKKIWILRSTLTEEDLKEMGGLVEDDT